MELKLPVKVEGSAIYDAEGRMIAQIGCTADRSFSPEQRDELALSIGYYVNTCVGLTIEDLEALGENRVYPLNIERHSRAGLASLLGTQNFLVTNLQQQVHSEGRARLQDRINRMKPYMRHKMHCAMLDPLDVSDKCTCGLEQLLQEIGGTV